MWNKILFLISIGIGLTIGPIQTNAKFSEEIPTTSAQCVQLLENIHRKMHEFIRSGKAREQIDALTEIARLQTLRAQIHNKNVRWGDIDSYYVYPMCGQFTGENYVHCSFLPPGVFDRVQYLPPEQTRSFLVTLQKSRDGSLRFYRNGQLLNTSSNHAKGSEDFVMLGNGEILSLASIPGNQHHSTPTQGGPLAAAGTWEVKDGLVLRVTSETLHYADPHKLFIGQFLIHLKRLGVPSPTSLSIYPPNAQVSFDRIANILNIPTSWPQSPEMLDWIQFLSTVPNPFPVKLTGWD